MDEAALQQALTDTQNLGEMPDADAVGTVGSPDCGDMVRLWIKYKEKDGKKVIDKASFQSFGCQTAIAVASIATELIRGKTKEEALSMSAPSLPGLLREVMIGSGSIFIRPSTPSSSMARRIHGPRCTPVFLARMASIYLVK